jgi:hypothetical protein
MRKSVLLPAPAHVRAYRGMAIFNFVAAFVTAVAVVYVEASGGHHGRYSAIGMLVFAAGLAVVAFRWLGTAERLQLQLRHLASHGRRFPVMHMETDTIERQFVPGWHVVVAKWRDTRGVEREALSEGFDYEPRPLLDAARVQVLADPFDPALCLVASDTLPPRERSGLDAARRAIVEQHAPTPLFMRSVPLWLPFVLVFAVVGALVWMLS